MYSIKSKLAKYFKRMSSLTTKGIVQAVVFLILALGLSTAIFLNQQSQDIRKSAAEATCTSLSASKSSCEAVPGCSWELKPITCTLADCNAGKSGCVPIAAPTSPCTLANCSTYSTCEYIPGEAAKTESCSKFGSQGSCSPSGCKWNNEEKANCTMGDCNSGKSGCWIQAAQTTSCTMSNCFAYPSFCTYKAGTSTAGYCSGPSGCSSLGAEECAVNKVLGCSWTAPKTTASSCTGTITLTPESCQGQYTTKNAYCDGYYTSVAAVPAVCKGTYVSGASSCSGEYNQGSCVGTPKQEEESNPPSTSKDCGWEKDGGYACKTLTECVQCVNGAMVDVLASQCKGLPCEPKESPIIDIEVDNTCSVVGTQSCTTTNGESGTQNCTFTEKSEDEPYDCTEKPINCDTCISNQKPNSTLCGNENQRCCTSKANDSCQSGLACVDNVCVNFKTLTRYGCNSATGTCSPNPDGAYFSNVSCATNCFQDKSITPGASCSKEGIQSCVSKEGRAGTQTCTFTIRSSSSPYDCSLSPKNCSSCLASDTSTSDTNASIETIPEDNQSNFIPDVETTVSNNNSCNPEQDSPYCVDVLTRRECIVNGTSSQWKDIQCSTKCGSSTGNCLSYSELALQIEQYDTIKILIQTETYDEAYDKNNNNQIDIIDVTSTFTQNIDDQQTNIPINPVVPGNTSSGIIIPPACESDAKTCREEKFGPQSGNSIPANEVVEPGWSKAPGYSEYFPTVDPGNIYIYDNRCNTSSHPDCDITVTEGNLKKDPTSGVIYLDQGFSISSGNINVYTDIAGQQILVENNTIIGHVLILNNVAYPAIVYGSTNPHFHIQNCPNGVHVPDLSQTLVTSVSCN